MISAAFIHLTPHSALGKSLGRASPDKTAQKKMTDDITEVKCQSSLHMPPYSDTYFSRGKPLIASSLGGGNAENLTSIRGTYHLFCPASALGKSLGRASPGKTAQKKLTDDLFSTPESDKTAQKKRSHDNAWHLSSVLPALALGSGLGSCWHDSSALHASHIVLLVPDVGYLFVSLSDS